MTGPFDTACRVVGQQLGHGRADISPPAENGADGVDDLLRLALFVQVAAGALAQQGGGVVCFGKAAQDQHGKVGEAGLDRLQRIDPALVGHGDVHQHHVNLTAARQFKRLTAVVGFARDAKVHVLGQKLAQAGAHDGVVVDDAYSDHGGLSGLLVRVK